MPDIFHYFTINAPIEKVFDAVSTPQGLSSWWTNQTKGNRMVSSHYILDFGPDYRWDALVSKLTDHVEFELIITSANADWKGTRIGFQLEALDKSKTMVRFHHLNWPSCNEHYKISCYCWAMYLRILKQNLENGLIVPYEDRLEV